MIGKEADFRGYVKTEEESPTWARITYTGAKWFKLGKEKQYKTYGEIRQALDEFQRVGRGHYLRHYLSQFKSGEYVATVFVI